VEKEEEKKRDSSRRSIIPTAASRFIIPADLLPPSPQGAVPVSSYVTICRRYGSLSFLLSFILTTQQQQQQQQQQQPETCYQGKYSGGSTREKKKTISHGRLDIRSCLSLLLCQSGSSSF
jgi:hypothetical protein